MPNKGHEAASPIILVDDVYNSLRADCCCTLEACTLFVHWNV